MSIIGEVFQSLTRLTTRTTQAIVKEGGAAAGDLVQGSIEAAVALPAGMLKRFAGDDPQAQDWANFFAKPPELLASTAAQLSKHAVSGASDIGSAAIGETGHGLEGLIRKADQEKTNEP